MAKDRVNYQCTECGYKSLKKMGICPECDGFNTFEEVKVEKEQVVTDPVMVSSLSNDNQVEKLVDVHVDNHKRIISGNVEFDNVMGGGTVVDSVNLLSAPPGTGKSTLLLEVANLFAKQGLIIFYASGEESKSQVKMRGLRILGEEMHENIHVKHGNNVEDIVDDIEQLDADIVIVDSINRMFSRQITNSIGGVKQINTCADLLVNKAKGNKNKPIAMFIVSQMTKDDEIRGSRELEHLVDSTLYLESVDSSPLRLLRANKNRFGNTDEVGLFEMNEYGLEPILNPSKYFISDRDYDVEGSAVSVVREGTRNIAVEIESLTKSNGFSYPSRVAVGIKKDTIQILIAVVERSLGISLDKTDVYLKLGGGLTTKSPSISFGIVMSIYSSMRKIKIPSNIAFIGEVSLTGEMKKVPNVDGMLRDLDRMGFKTVYIPKGNRHSDLKLNNLEIIELSRLSEIKDLIN